MTAYIPSESIEITINVISPPNFIFIDRTTQNYIYWNETFYCKPDETKNVNVGTLLGFKMRVLNNGAGSGKPYYLVCKAGTDCNEINRIAEHESETELLPGQWIDFTIPTDKQIPMPNINLNIEFKVGWLRDVIYIHDTIGTKKRRRI